MSKVTQSRDAICDLHTDDLHGYDEEAVANQLEDINQVKSKIARYFIVDAVLSKTFGIESVRCVAAWNKHVAVAEAIRDEVWSTLPSLAPLVFKQASFALRMLNYLLRRHTQTVVCGYRAGGCNFIVAIVESNTCICSSYAFYVQAMAEVFGMQHIEICSEPGHAYNIARDEKRGVTIRFDTGFENNDVILVNVLQHENDSTSEILDDFLQIGSNPDFEIEMGDWRACEVPISHLRGLDKTLALLVRETVRKKRYTTTLRNLALLSLLYPESRWLKDVLHLLVVEMRLASLLDAGDTQDAQTTAIALYDRFAALTSCVNNNVELARFVQEFVAQCSGILVTTFRLLEHFLPRMMRFGLPRKAGFVRFLWDCVRDLLTKLHSTRLALVVNDTYKTRAAISDLGPGGSTLVFELLRASALRKTVIQEGATIVYNPEDLLWNREAQSLFVLEPREDVMRNVVLVYYILDRLTTQSPVATRQYLVKK